MTAVKSHVKNRDLQTCHQVHIYIVDEGATEAHGRSALIVPPGAGSRLKMIHVCVPSFSWILGRKLRAHHN